MQTKEYNHYNPRTTWESCMHDINVAINKMKELMRNDCVHLGEDTFEIYGELDEIEVSTNYVRSLTNQHQYISAEDYAYEMASYLQHTESEEILTID